MMLGAMLLAAAGVDKAPVVLEPSSKWQVDYGETGCMLARTFGVGPEQVVVGWRALPLEETMELLVRTHDVGQIFRQGVADVTLSPGISERYTFDDFPTQGGGRSLRLRVKVEQFGTMPERAVMTIVRSTGSPLSVALVAAEKGFSALRTCNEDLLERWKIDATAEKRAATPAKLLNQQAFFNDIDYPEEPFSRGQQGATAILYTIGIDGHVGDCRIVLKSGSNELDQSACDHVSKKVRYEAALDAQGKPMVTHITTRFRWMLYESWQTDAAYRAFVAQSIKDAKADPR